MNTQTNTIEQVTMNAHAMVSGFLTNINAADDFDVLRFNATEKSNEFLKLIRAQYTCLEDARFTKSETKQVGALPHAVYKAVILELYENRKKLAAELGRDFSCIFENFYDAQRQVLAKYIRTGEIKNRKKETLIADAIAEENRLEKKLIADMAKAEKLAAEKLAADKAKAEAEAEKIKSEADEIINDVHEFADFDPSAADAIKSDLCDILDDAEASIAEAELSKADAIKTANKVTIEAKKAEAEVVKTTEKLAKTKAKLANLSAGKSEPSPSLNIIEFSKDCREMMVDVLNEMVKDYSDVELLCLSTLINKRFKK